MGKRIWRAFFVVAALDFLLFFPRAIVKPSFLCLLTRDQATVIVLPLTIAAILTRYNDIGVDPLTFHNISTKFVRCIYGMLPS